jgi:hypothetical protein
MADVPTYRPSDLARPELATTSFSTPMFSVPEIQLDAGHEAAKQAFAQRQVQQPELAELHRQALETARNEPQERDRQERAMRALSGHENPFKTQHLDSPEATGRAARDAIHPY